MRPPPIMLEVFNLTPDANAAREAEFLAMHGRPDAMPLPAEPDETSRSRSGWLSLAKRLTRWRLDAGARRAGG